METRRIGRRAGAAVTAGGLAALGAVLGAGGCKQIIGWESATLTDGGFGGSGGSGSSSSGSSTSSTSSSSSSSGTATVCQAGTTRPCYTGDAGTEDAGACHGGTQTCAQDGMSWGTSCDGEVTPKPRTCADMPGVSCDGIDCVLWQIGWSGGSVAALAPNTDNSVVVTGYAPAAVQIGNKSIPAGTFTARFNPDGTLAWVIQGGGAVLSIDAAGDSFVGGSNNAGVQVGSTMLAGGHYAFKLDPNGQVLWAKSYGGVGPGGVTSIAACPDGDVLVAGTFYTPGMNGATSMDWGDGAIPPVSGVNDTGFVAKLNGNDGTGTMMSSGQRWTLTFAGYHHGYGTIGPYAGIGGPAGSETVTILANVGGVPVTVAGTTLTSAGGSDIGVFRLAPTGTSPSATQIGDDKDQIALSLSVAADGTTLFTGSFFGSMNPAPWGAIGTTLTSKAMLPTIVNANDVYGDGFFAAWNPSGSTLRLAGSFGTLGHATGARLGADGGIVLTGTFTGALNLGAGALDAGQGTSVLLAKFKPDGSVLWNRQFKHAQDDSLWPALAAPSDGSTWLGGFASVWPLDFGTGTPLNTSAQPNVGFLARFAP